MLISVEVPKKVVRAWVSQSHRMDLERVDTADNYSQRGSSCRQETVLHKMCSNTQEYRSGAEQKYTCVAVDKTICGLKVGGAVVIRKEMKKYPSLDSTRNRRERERERGWSEEKFGLIAVRFTF